MKQIVCLYSEGLEHKLAVLGREKEKITINKIFTVSSNPNLSVDTTDQLGDFTDDSLMANDVSFESLDTIESIGAIEEDSAIDSTDTSEIASRLAEFDLSKAQFIPVITDPNVTFHICANLVNAVDAYSGRRHYKIYSIKNAEIALANFVSKTTKFFPEDYSLIIYIGKEYSKLIFLEGQNLKHIGATLDIGIQNLHTYDENLVLSFYGTFPEANVSELQFNMFDSPNLSEEDSVEVSSYSIPIAAAYEYYAEADKELSGINLLPKYIFETQRFLQFGWHSFAILPLLFIAAFYFTFSILSNYQEVSELDNIIHNLEQLAVQNLNIIDQMDPLSARIAGFDNTQSILDSAMSGTEVWGKTLEKVSNFVERRRNFWVSHLETRNNTNVLIKGFSLSRNVLTEFAEYSNSSILENVLYEPLREKNAFAYIMNFEIEKNKE
jgi:hypothetical protein